ncbi:hypothetical protein H6G06_26790 [Anabaena sphaerica FACHB-251]|uniref:Uncharacterized protein n=1 Tax=Anabaena sphaerica FACHB-251 TaxID=2692883 RepID=A0A926WPL9_9NOST|nr:hypothetical protein [Anabaena sphaerica]MBD2296983.1 hypothetical protein [Anabaena sphaerica FACHB-251]
MLNTIYHFPCPNGNSIPSDFFNEVALVAYAPVFLYHTKNLLNRLNILEQAQITGEAAISNLQKMMEVA